MQIFKIQNRTLCTTRTTMPNRYIHSAHPIAVDVVRNSMSQALNFNSNEVHQCSANKCTQAINVDFIFHFLCIFCQCSK